MLTGGAQCGKDQAILANCSRGPSAPRSEAHGFAVEGPDQDVDVGGGELNRSG
jgi:hypothetical protein